MTKLKQLYSQHRVLNIPDLFQLSVAKFIYSTHLIMVNYFSDITSIHKYQTRNALLQSIIFPE